MPPSDVGGFVDPEDPSPAALVPVDGVAGESWDWPLVVASDGGVFITDDGGEAACDDAPMLLKINFSICFMLGLSYQSCSVPLSKLTALICLPNVNFFSAWSCGFICSTRVSRSAPLSKVSSFSTIMSAEDSRAIRVHVPVGLTNDVVSVLVTHQQVKWRSPIWALSRHNFHYFTLLLHAPKDNALLNHVRRKLVSAG